MKTSKEIQGDIIALLKDSPIAKTINGAVYRQGLRPRDSQSEDAIVIFTAGLPDEIEIGVITINIYVPDIAPYKNGVHVENARRTAEIERASADWVESLTANKSDYLFRLKQTISTEKDIDINQHFVVIRLDYRYFGG